MKYIYITIGTPGVGKSTFLDKVSNEIYDDDRLKHYVIGPDLIRSTVQSPVILPNGKEGISQESEGFVWSFINDILDKKIYNGELVIVDATHSRNTAISRYKKYSDEGYRVIAIDFRDEATLEEILERNKNRTEIKQVPEDIIYTVYERCKTLEIPSWVQVIKPNEFKDHFTNNIFDFSDWDSITAIGDIHGCSDELTDLLDNLEISLAVSDDETCIIPEKKALVFVGDYFDRGPDPVGVFRILQKLINQKKYPNYWVMLLKGNHEEPLKFYKEYFRFVYVSFRDWLNDQAQVIKTVEKLQAELRYQKSRTWFNRLLSGTSKLDHDETIQKLQEQIEELNPVWDKAIELLSKDFPTAFSDFDAYIEKLKSDKTLFDIFKHRVYKLGLPGYLVKDGSFNKLKRTSLQTVQAFLLSDITYREVSALYRKLAQLFFVDFHGRKILITHGGLSKSPDKTTPTRYLVRGTGNYDEVGLNARIFNELHPDIIQVHGHRNPENQEVQMAENVWNINGDVEIGVKAVTFRSNLPGVGEVTEIAPKPKTLAFSRNKKIEAAKKFKAKKLTIDEEKTGLLQLFQDHKYINVLKLENDIASINFSKKAFQEGIWDQYTVRARGLFVSIRENLAKDDIHIIARGYEKFFNLGEKHGIQKKDLSLLSYPVQVFEKANGYLGLLSVDHRDKLDIRWFISSKSTDEGKHAQKFTEIIKPSLNKNLQEYIIENNITLVFEVIDPIFDPHIQEYKEPELVLLEAIKNDLDFESLGFDILPSIVKMFNSTGVNVRPKERIKVCDTVHELLALINQANSVPEFTKDSIEGYVIEDSEGYKFKLKTEWYSFWKWARGMQQRVANKLKKKFQRNPQTKAVLDKSDIIQYQARLRTANQIRVFNLVKKLGEEDFNKLSELSVPELRKLTLEKYPAS